jgi:hypothetical protein
MNTKSMFKMGLLSIIAATGLCGVSYGVAADADTRDHSKRETTTAGSDDFDAGTRSLSEGLMATGGSDDSKMPQSRASQLQVVDSEGNVYFLTPLQTKDGKVTVEYVVPYRMPTSH